MKQSKKNAILRFLFSFMPGAAEMYMGFMKNGFSLLVLFMITFAIPAAMCGGDIFFVIPAVIYIYAFFHAVNLSKMDDEDFNRFEDRWVWEEFLDGNSTSLKEGTARKWIAIILIIFGVCCIWSNTVDSLSDILTKYLNANEYKIFRVIVDGIPQYVIAILAIITGAKLISGKKEVIEAQISQAETDK